MRKLRGTSLMQKFAGFRSPVVRQAGTATVSTRCSSCAPGAAFCLQHTASTHHCHLSVHAAQCAPCRMPRSWQHLTIFSTSNATSANDFSSSGPHFCDVTGIAAACSAMASSEHCTNQHARRPCSSNAPPRISAGPRLHTALSQSARCSSPARRGAAAAYVQHMTQHSSQPCTRFP